MKRMEPPDSHHLSAALGWLGLGNWQEANEELERIAPERRGHPTVLALRWEIYARANKWDMAGDIAKILLDADPSDPLWWLNLAYATRRRSDGTLAAAQTVLEEAHARFPTEAVILYNLACYACQLGDLKRAWIVLETAFDIGDGKQLKLKALDDPDFEPLWADIITI